MVVYFYSLVLVIGKVGLGMVYGHGIDPHSVGVFALQGTDPLIVPVIVPQMQSQGLFLLSYHSH